MPPQHDPEVDHTVANKGKWAQGITPRNFVWVLQDRLGICERPGGYGANHRRVRRQEEIIWIREQGFTRVISLIGANHNLHNYDELGVKWLHRPMGAEDTFLQFQAVVYPELERMLAAGEKLLLHQEEVGDRICGLVGGYLLWTGLVPYGPQTISVTERLTGRQLGPTGRRLIAHADELRAKRPEKAGKNGVGGSDNGEAGEDEQASEQESG